MQFSNVQANDFLDDELFDRLERPSDQATTLPNAAYTDPRFLELERRKLFARTWMLAGFEAQIPAPGDVTPTTIAGMPVLLLRDGDGRVRAFHNVCRHRGATLVDAPCQGLTRLVCPYHAWTYELDGRLRARPHFKGAGRHGTTEEHWAGPGLVPLRFGVWHGFIFVNLDGQAPAFDEYMMEPNRLVGERDLFNMSYGGYIDFEFKANWKLVNENFFDVYHTFKIHPKLIELSPLDTKRPPAVDGPCFWTSHRIVQPQEGRGKGLPFINGFPDREGLFFHLFPSVCINLWPDHVAILQVEPIAPDLTLERLHIFFSPGAMDEQYAKMRQNTFDLWRELNAEDIAPLELMQRGRLSAGFDGGVLTRYWDDPLREFAKQVAEAVSA